MLAIIIGERGSLTPSIARKRARLLATALRQMPSDEVIDVAIYGYDDDPRELWEITESRDYLIKFADVLIEHGVSVDRLLSSSQRLIELCRAAAAGKPITTIGSREDAIQDGIDAILQHQKSRRRH